MLAGQSTSVLRKVIELFLADYLEVATETLPNQAARDLTASIVGHQIEIMKEMPPEVLAELFVRATALSKVKPDEQMVKDLLEIS